MFPHRLQGVRQGATGVPNGKVNRFEICRIPARLVADLRGIEHSSLHPEEGHVARREGPFGQELDRLSARELVEETALPGPRAEERVDLEGDHRPGIEAQGARVFGKVGQQILRIEESHYGDSRSNVHRVHVVSVDERIEGRRTLSGHLQWMRAGCRPGSSNRLRHRRPTRRTRRRAHARRIQRAMLNMRALIDARSVFRRSYTVRYY